MTGGRALIEIDVLFSFMLYNFLIACIMLLQSAPRAIKSTLVLKPLKKDQPISMFVICEMQCVHLPRYAV